ncbi:MAG TPA: DUF1932 domain-containing protein [Candidatus Acidoferrales bacterium]|nr:DUF1932 domain-containing protein [Candidatus Acidoferrales bacterium]
MSTPPRICLIGFGEVGQILASDLASRGVGPLSAWDVLFADPASVPSRGLSGSRVRPGINSADAVTGTQVVISAVTAAECIAAACTAGASIATNAVFLDLNSVSPETKADAGRAIAAAGGRYVEAALMSPISPKRSGSPILLGGPHAADFLPVAHRLGFSGAEVFSDVIGRASAAKMCRSVMIKGIEALLTESLLAARRYGVEDAVLESLAELLPARDWRGLSRYMISRSLQHGKRRADEMREVALTVADAGLDPWMSAACAKRQHWAASHADATSHESLEAILDAVLAAVPDPHGAP